MPGHPGGDQIGSYGSDRKYADLLTQGDRAKTPISDVAPPKGSYFFLMRATPILTFRDKGHHAQAFVFVCS